MGDEWEAGSGGRSELVDSEGGRWVRGWRWVVDGG